MTHYLTKVTLDTNNPELVNKLGTRTKLHAFVESAFLNEYNLHIKSRHIWNLNSRQELLILSENEPDKKALSKFGKVESTVFDNFVNNLHENQLLQFSMEANPLNLKIKDRRIPAYGAKGRIEWLKHQAKRFGFEINNVTVTSWNVYKIENSRHQFSLKSTTFEGALRITDLEKFKQALTGGIGREKSYGMGMLMVRPILQ